MGVCLKYSLQQYTKTTNLIGFWRQYYLFSPPLLCCSNSDHPTTSSSKETHYGEERVFERINVFTATNKVPWTADTVQNNPPNYVTGYETDLYHSQIKPLLLFLRLLGAVPIEI